MRTHRYAVGQHVSYARDYSPDTIWLSGYEIVSLLPAGNREPQYQVRSDRRTYDQVVWESQLQQEFGRRTMRAAAALTSPDRRARQSRIDPKKASQYQDLTRWDDEGGAPRSGHHWRERSPPSPPTAEPALYYFNVRSEGGLFEDPEGEVYPDLQAVREVAVAMARDMIATCDQKDEHWRGWSVEVTNRANQQVLTVAFAAVLGPNAAG